MKLQELESKLVGTGRSPGRRWQRAEHKARGGLFALKIDSCTAVVVPDNGRFEGAGENVLRKISCAGTARRRSEHQPVAKRDQYGAKSLKESRGEAQSWKQLQKYLTTSEG